MLIPNEVLDGVSSTPTSSFPYQSVGPIDFSNYNLVRTKQIDYYYGSISSGSVPVLLSTVEQDYDPTTAIIIIVFLLSLFIAVCFWFIKKFKKPV